MPKYRITLFRTVYEKAIVELESADEFEAEHKALILDCAGTLNWKETESDTEVANVREVEHAT